MIVEDDESFERFKIKVQKLKSQAPVVKLGYQDFYSWIHTSKSKKVQSLRAIIPSLKPNKLETSSASRKANGIKHKNIDKNTDQKPTSSYLTKSEIRKSIVSGIKFSVLPLSLLVQWPEYFLLKQNTALLTIEFFSNPIYFEKAEELMELWMESLRSSKFNLTFQCVLKPSLSPRELTQLRTSSSSPDITSPNNKYSGINQVEKGSLSRLENRKDLRIGAFEVQLALSLGSNAPIFHILHSKLSSSLWPDQKRVVKASLEILNDHNCPLIPTTPSDPLPNPSLPFLEKLTPEEELFLQLFYPANSSNPPSVSLPLSAGPSFSRSFASIPNGSEEEKKVEEGGGGGGGGGKGVIINDLEEMALKSSSSLPPPSPPPPSLKSIPNPNTERKVDTNETRSSSVSPRGQAEVNNESAERERDDGGIDFSYYEHLLKGDTNGDEEEEEEDEEDFEGLFQEGWGKGEGDGSVEGSKGWNERNGSHTASHYDSHTDSHYDHGEEEEEGEGEGEQEDRVRRDAGNLDYTDDFSDG